MSQQYIGLLKDSIKDQKIRVALFPFQDGSLMDNDPVLSNGFAVILYNILEKIDRMGVYHPFVVFDSLKSQSIVQEEYFSDEKIIPSAATLGATHAVYGMFQKQGFQIRFFLKVVDVTNSKNIGGTQEFMTDQSNRFFSVATEAARAILKTIGGIKPSEEALKTFEKTSPTFESFRFYVKGMEKSAFYNEVDLGIAKAWFEKSSALSYSFKPAYEEKARTLFMMALLGKQMGKDTSLLWAEGSATLNAGEIVSANGSSSKKTAKLKQKESSPSLRMLARQMNGCVQ